jgi:2-keto-4-pentenoate hydratase/2-oxohepta-3-ene-1,7-dioic acid hydratase in catechol pathway
LKLANIWMNGRKTPVVVLEDHAAILPPAQFPQSMLEWVQGGPSLLEKAHGYLARNEYEQFPLDGLEFMAPIDNPGKVVAIGLNYLDHCREQNIPAPDRPIVFTKFTTSIIGPGEAITWDPAVTNQVDYEVELGVIIGRRARRVPVENALDYVFGYTVINDISARDLQFSDRQWVRSKSLDTFCPIGPVIVTTDEIPNPQQLGIKCTVNNQVLQNSSTSEMVFSVAQLISRLSHSFTFEPGDVIATGTPDGVGIFRKPPIFLKDGDTVVVEVEGIGRLSNPVRL